MTGAEAERELRKQENERAKRKGPSTAMLEAEVWFYIVQHHQVMYMVSAQVPTDLV